MASARTTLLCAALMAAAVACLDPVSFSLAGHACGVDGDCGAGLFCDLGQHCARPSSGGGPDGYVPREPAFPIRAVTYTSALPYLWSVNPHETPTQGYYDLGDAGVFAAQLSALEYGNIQVGVYRFDGIGSDSSAALKRDLIRTEGHDFHWAISFEREDTAPTTTVLDAAFVLRGIRDNYASHPNFLKLDGGYVVFVHSSGSEDVCGVAARFVGANQQYRAGAYLVLHADAPPGARYRTCPDQPNAWYVINEGAPELHSDQVFGISPGSFPSKDSTPTLPRDLSRFTASISRTLDAGTQFELITSFNEWPRGTELESAVGWESDSGYGQYLDALHAHPIVVARP